MSIYPHPYFFYLFITFTFWSDVVCVCVYLGVILNSCCASSVLFALGMRTAMVTHARYDDKIYTGELCVLD